MATGAPDPVENWAPVFTKHLRDEQILAATYALTRTGDGTWCNLCDSLIPAEPEAAHMRRHRAELKAWRARSRKENEKAAAARLAEARDERRRMRELGMDGRASADGSGTSVGGEEATPNARDSRRPTVGQSRSAAKGGKMKSTTETAGSAKASEPSAKPAGPDLFKRLLARIREAKIGKEVIVKDDGAYARVMLEDKRNAGYVVAGKTKLNVYPQAMASDMPKSVGFKKVKLGSHHFGRGEVIVPVETEKDFAAAVAALEAAAKLPAPERKTAKKKPAAKAPEKAAAKRVTPRAAARKNGTGGRRGRKAGTASAGK